jgi:hypothetical protein
MLSVRYPLLESVNLRSCNMGPAGMETLATTLCTEGGALLKQTVVFLAPANLIPWCFAHPLTLRSPFDPNHARIDAIGHFASLADSGSLDLRANFLGDAGVGHAVLLSQHLKVGTIALQVLCYHLMLCYCATISCCATISFRPPVHISCRVISSKPVVVVR